MKDYLTEVERCDALEAIHWKEKWMEVNKKLERAEYLLGVYEKALDEYEQARKFLNESGDDPLSYVAESF